MQVEGSRGTDLTWKKGSKEGLGGDPVSSACLHLYITSTYTEGGLHVSSSLTGHCLDLRLPVYTFFYFSYYPV